MQLGRLCVTVGIEETGIRGGFKKKSKEKKKEKLQRYSVRKEGSAPAE